MPVRERERSSPTPRATRPGLARMRHLNSAKGQVGLAARPGRAPHLRRPHDPTDLRFLDWRQGSDVLGVPFPLDRTDRHAGLEGLTDEAVRFVDQLDCAYFRFRFQIRSGVGGRLVNTSPVGVVISNTPPGKSFSCHPG